MNLAKFVGHLPLPHCKHVQRLAVESVCSPRQKAPLRQNQPREDRGGGVFSLDASLFHRDASSAVLAAPFPFSTGRSDHPSHKKKEAGPPRLNEQSVTQWSVAAAAPIARCCAVRIAAITIIIMLETGDDSSLWERPRRWTPKRRGAAGQGPWGPSGVSIQTSLARRAQPSSRLPRLRVQSGRPGERHAAAR